MDGLYKKQYETAEQRALYLVARKGYGSYTEMAEALGITKSYVHNMLTTGVPASYAGYLGRKFGFHPGVLAFESLLNVVLKTIDIDYAELVDWNDFFDHQDRKYILAGKYIKDPAKYLRQKDKQVEK